jgi:hypothetical protein
MNARCPWDLLSKEYKPGSEIGSNYPQPDLYHFFLFHRIRLKKKQGKTQEKHRKSHFEIGPWQNPDLKVFVQYSHATIKENPGQV